MKKQLISEVKKFQEIAGLLRENNEYDESSDSESDDTDAMGGINEMGEGITLNIPENTDYRELAKAVAKVLIEDYGEHNYKPFLQALIAELK